MISHGQVLKMKMNEKSVEFEYRPWLLGESTESRRTAFGGYRNSLRCLSLPVEDSW